MNSSIVSYKDRGIGGNNKYRGNCSPALIADLIDTFHVKQISDYMCGSNTTADVAKAKGIEFNTYDLHSGFNLLTDDIAERCNSIMWHPPYWSIIKYSDNMYSAKEVEKKYGYNPNEYDLSHCKTWDDFVQKMNYCCLKQYASLERGGMFFILLGDIKKNRKLYSMILDIAKPGIIDSIVIKEQHNCFSDNIIYKNNNFISIKHEYLLILRKDNSLFYEVKITKNYNQDIRDVKNATWKDIIASILEDYNRPVTLSEIYIKLEGHKKTESNKYWKEKIRQTLQIYPNIFKKQQQGVWKLSY